MPQILNTLVPSNVSEIVDSMVEASLPKLSSTSWAAKLEEKGLSVDSLAEQYVQALYNCKPAQKEKAIRELLQDLGVTKGPAESTQRPSIIINGENISLQQLIIPERNF